MLRLTASKAVLAQVPALVCWRPRAAALRLLLGLGLGLCRSPSSARAETLPSVALQQEERPLATAWMRREAPDPPAPSQELIAMEVSPNGTQTVALGTAAGSQGPAGRKGRKGPPGPRGADNMTSSIHARGRRGPRGKRGPRGDPGLRGAPGKRGPRGHPGFSVEFTHKDVANLSSKRELVVDDIVHGKSEVSYHMGQVLHKIIQVARKTDSMEQQLLNQELWAKTLLGNMQAELKHFRFGDGEVKNMTKEIKQVKKNETELLKDEAKLRADVVKITEKSMEGIPVLR